MFVGAPHGSRFMRQEVSKPLAKGAIILERRGPFDARDILAKPAR